MKPAIVSFVAGVLFAVGLVLAGMGQPSTVVGFLDFTGRWNPSLMLLMCAGIPVVMVGHFLSKRFAKPTFAERFPGRSTTIDRSLVGGSAIFGVGWAIGGACPGPALLTLASGFLHGALVVAGMVVGMLLFSVFRKRSQGATSNETVSA